MCMPVMVSRYAFSRLATVHCVYGKHLQEEGKYEKALEMFERATEYRQEDKEIITKRYVVS